MRARRIGAFAIDVVGFGALAWFACKLLDASAHHAHPPYQAKLAAARIVPTLLLLYAAWFIAPMAVWRASIGKRLLGLVVVQADGDAPLSMPAIVVRETVGKWLSVAMNCAGLIDGLLTGLAFHDRLVGSCVVDRDEARVEAEPRAFDGAEWQEVVWPSVGALAAGAALLFWSMRTSGFLYGLLWRGAFYVPHEAGHLVVGAVFPHLIGVAAGAWGQLLFPAIAAVVFARRRWPMQLAGTLVWLGFSLFDIGRYAGDAWDRELPLPVAMGDEFSEEHLDSHDWWQMLSAARILRYAAPIGESITALGWVAVAVGIGGAAWVAWQSGRRERSAAPEGG
ncbi:MAG: RDD family protein [Archangium sp.]|nr:RDD family protein [Archangium sp.]